MPKVDLFEALSHTDMNDYQYFDGLSIEDKKSLQPFILLKWLSCTNDRLKLLILNKASNQYIFKLAKYPNIAYRLLTISGNGESEFYKWKKKAEKIETKPLTVKLLMDYYRISKKEAIRDSELVDLDNAIAIANELGEWDIIDKLKKEF